MSENPIKEIDLDSLQKAFISYLQGVPLASIQQLLSLMLRVEDPIYFAPKDVAQIVTNWALLRSNADGYLVHEYYLRSIELIAAADHSRTLDSFDPSKFYMPYFEGLVRSCPKEEKEAFRQKLKTLRERLASEWGYQFRRLDTNTTETSIVPNKENTSVTPTGSPTEEKLTYPNKEVVNSQPNTSANIPAGLYARPENVNQPVSQPPASYYPPPTNLANNGLADSPMSSFNSYPNNANPVNAYPPNNYGQVAQSLPASPISSFNSYPKANAGNYPIASPPNSNYGQVEQTPNSEAISPTSSYPPSTSSYGKIAEPPAGYTASTNSSSFSSKRNDITGVDINNLTTYEVIFDLADTVDSFDKSSQAKEEDTQATPEKISAKIHKLRMSLLKLSLEEQNSYVAELQSLIFELATKQLYLTPYLEALIDISITSFNAGQGVFGAQLLYIVEQVYYLEGFDEKVRYGLRKFRAATELSEPHMRSMSSDPTLIPALRIYLAHFDELAPDKLLENLTHETDRQKQRFWMLLIESHKETATPHLLQQLSKLVANNDNWPMIRNLIAVIGRVPPQERIVQRQAIGLLGSYLKSPFIQLRYAALTSLEVLAIDDALPYITSIFDEKLYSDSELEETERLIAYLKMVIALIGKFNSERALRVLMEISLGKHISFVNVKSIQQLQLQAMQLLASKRHLLSANLVNPLTERIRAITNPWKKLMSRFLGEDEMELLALLEVVGAINTQEIRQLLVEIKDRYAGQTAGRRAGELLAKL
ncbi:MAG: hypothetical protein WAQ98_03760 [Blastocatellia bacterium]